MFLTNKKLKNILEHSLWWIRSCMEMANRR